MTTDTKKRVIELLEEIKSAGFRNRVKGDPSGELKDMPQFKSLEAILAEECLPVFGGIMPRLKRPVCFLDLETTGTNVDLDFIVEISILRVNLNLTEEVYTKRVNPGIPIPAEATAIHGITDDMVDQEPVFPAIASDVLRFIDGCDIVGYNSTRFDVPMLSSMLNRAGVQWNWRKISLVDVCTIYKKHEGRTLSDAVRTYLNRDHVGGHAAEADVQATKEIFIRQLLKYDDIPKSMLELELYCQDGKQICDFDGKFKINEKGYVVFSFGKHKDKIAKFEKNYLEWMVNTGEFTRDTKAFARTQLLISI